MKVAEVGNRNPWEVLYILKALWSNFLNEKPGVSEMINTSTEVYNTIISVLQEIIYTIKVHIYCAAEIKFGVYSPKC